ncbi:MAG: SUMF1/EgtB/PvdO family nonheme iron enzyme [Planctomycetaceae bacterium]|nr:SUMF1/EgtB/PvdO family nonheme iron enzyme [Planctomycetaceae bacterium]
MAQRLPTLGRSAALGFALSALAATDATAVQVTPYGSGVNPPGSLIVTSGIPMVGGSFTVGVSNTSSASAPTALAFLSFATAPDPAFPAGTVLPGFGLADGSTPGELLLSVAAPNPLATLGPVPWAGGSAAPASFSLSVPPVPSLSGLSIYMQGALLELVSGPGLGVTNGLQVTLSEPSFQGLVPIQPGTFQMGSNAATGTPYFGSDNHKPVHQVTISQPFWIGQHEVTQAEYLALMGTNPSQHVSADRPVERVTWFKAMAYCEALNVQQTALGKVPTGYQYRLPTEAEWEYACRADTTTEFHYGDALLCDQARFAHSNHSDSSCVKHWGPFPVGSYTPNARGLYDMHGNVWEWCLDGFSNYTPSAKTDPYVSSSPIRIIRGGSWRSDSHNCRAAVRHYIIPLYSDDDYGFRVVLAPVLVP